MGQNLLRSFFSRFDFTAGLHTCHEGDNRNNIPLDKVLVFFSLFFYYSSSSCAFYFSSNLKLLTCYSSLLTRSRYIIHQQLAGGGFLLKLTSVQWACGKGAAVWWRADSSVFLCFKEWKLSMLKFCWSFCPGWCGIVTSSVQVCSNGWVFFSF